MPTGTCCSGQRTLIQTQDESFMASPATLQMYQMESLSLAQGWALQLRACCCLLRFPFSGNEWEDASLAELALNQTP